MRAELQSDFYQAIVVGTVVAMAWMAFTVWTLRWLGRRDGADPPDLRIKIGVRGFGVAPWLVCTGMAGYVLLSQFGGAEPWAWGGVAAVSYLTLLVVPTFYDSIEIARERALAKFQRRVAKSNAFSAAILTFLEVLATLVFLRWVFRFVRGLIGTGRSAPPPSPASA